MRWNYLLCAGLFLSGAALSTGCGWNKSCCRPSCGPSCTPTTSAYPAPAAPCCSTGCGGPAAVAPVQAYGAPPIGH